MTEVDKGGGPAERPSAGNLPGSLDSSPSDSDAESTPGQADSDVQGSLTPRLATGALVGVLVVFVMLGTFVAFKTPAYEAADEPSHVQNIETLASGHWYGISTKCRLTRHGLVDCTGGDESHQAPLYYLLFAGWQRLVGVPPRAPARLPANFLESPSRPEDWLTHSSSDHRFLLWLRLPNVVLGALTVLTTFFAVRLVSKDPWTPVVAASIVAFLPRFVFLSSVVTNDNLVDFLGAVFTLVALRYARAPSRWRIATVGGVFGLLVITKLSVLPVALVLVALAWMVPGWRRRAGFLAVSVLAALGVSGWYLVQNTVRYGDPLARAASSHYLEFVGGLGTFWAPYKVGNPFSLVFDRVPVRIGNSFWYQSGWNQFRWSWPVNLLFWLVAAAMLVGLFVHRDVGRRRLVTLVAVSLTSFLSVWAVSFQTETYQARYVFVGLAAVAALLALGVQRWTLPTRFLLPAMGLCGTIVAIQQDVLAVHWT